MKFLEDRWNMFRNIPDQDMRDYAPILRHVAHGNVLEIGVCLGVSTTAFLLGLDEYKSGRLWSIDIDPKCGEIFSHPRWSFIAGDSREVDLTQFPELDVLFVDGNHSYETASSDLRRFSDLVGPYGLIMMHDVQPSAEWLPRIKAENWYPVEECAQAWRDFCADHPQWPSKIISGMTGLGMMVKQP